MRMKMVNQTARAHAARPAPRTPGGDPENKEDPGGVVRRDPLCTGQTAERPGTRSIPEQWLDLHGDALFRYALLLVGDEHRAEDLVQETLLAALQARTRYSAAASERTWLIAILRHKVIDERRRDRRHDRYLSERDPVVDRDFSRFGKWRKPPSRWTPSPLALLESQEFWAIFKTCMRALPPPLREAFALRVIEGLDAAQTCRILEITSANLWTLLFRARERLRRCLEGKWVSKEEL